MSGRTTRGAVLPAVVLVMLGMTLVAHAAFVTARRQLEVAEVGRELLRASLAAEAGLRTFATELPTALSLQAIDSLGPVQRAWGDNAEFRITAVPLTHEILWIVGEGRSKSVPVPIRLGQLLWRMEPVARVVRAAAVASGRSVVGAVSTHDWWSVPQGADTLACEGLVAELSRRSAAPPSAAANSVDSVVLGRLRLGSFASAASIRITGAITPGPVVRATRCETEVSGNWGNPSSPVDPCGSHRPLIWSSGDLQVIGGSGQGILVAEGNLIFTAATEFRGLVLAGGDVHVNAGSRVEGMIRSGGRILVGPDGRLDGSACAVWAALDAAPLLRFAIPLEPGRRVVLP